jgi:signal peptidase I
MNIMENLNSILWLAFGVLSVVEAFLRWGIPGYRKNPDNAGMVETIDSFWVAMAVALSLKAVLIQPFTIPSGSMEDTLQVGDYILVNKFAYGYSFLNKTPRFLQFQKPQKGDIVVFVYPVDPSKDFIKRCRGVAGDVLEYKDKVLYVNGIQQIEPFVKHDKPDIEPKGLREFYPGDQQPDPNGPLGDYTKSSRDNFGPVTVLPGHYFMMGDNRDNSWDSRYWNQLDEKLIKGKAWLIYWHSVSFPVLFALLAFFAAVVSSVLWVLALAQKRPPIPAGTPPPGNQESPKTFLLSMAVCLVLGIGFVAWTGFRNFQDEVKTLKERVFTVVR